MIGMFIYLDICPHGFVSSGSCCKDFKGNLKLSLQMFKIPSGQQRKSPEDIKISNVIVIKSYIKKTELNVP